MIIMLRKCSMLHVFCFPFHAIVWGDWLMVFVMLLCEFCKKPAHRGHLIQWNLCHFEPPEISNYLFCLVGVRRRRMEQSWYDTLCTLLRRDKWHKWTCGWWISRIDLEETLWVFVRGTTQASCLFLMLLANTMLGRRSDLSHDLMALQSSRALSESSETIVLTR